MTHKRKHSHTKEYLRGLTLDKQIQIAKEVLGADQEMFLKGIVLKEKSENKVCKIAKYINNTPKEKIEKDINKHRINRPDISRVRLFTFR